MAFMRARKRTASAALAAATALVTAGALLTGCSAVAPPDGGAAAATPERYSGDEELLEVVRTSFRGPDEVAAVAYVADGEIRTAFVRAEPETRFEIGSITKTFTGLLLAEAIERGEVALDDPIGQYLDLDGAPIADVPLGAFAAHRSGLQTFPSDPDWQAAALELDEQGKDPIDESLDELLELARAEQLPPEPEPEYSNFGAALLGQAVAAAAGMEYADLLEERILEPLDLDETSLPVEDDDVPDELAQGTMPDGRDAEPSTLAAFAPAGGIVTTVEDLARYAQAVIDGTFADSPALEQNPMGDDGIGYLWGVSSEGGHDFVSHGGMTAGFTSSLLIDRTAGTAAIVFVNRGGRPIDDIAQRVLTELG